MPPAALLGRREHRRKKERKKPRRNKDETEKNGARHHSRLVSKEQKDPNDPFKSFHRDAPTCCLVIGCLCRRRERAAERSTSCGRRRRPEAPTGGRPLSGTIPASSSDWNPKMNIFLPSLLLDVSNMRNRKFIPRDKVKRTASKKKKKRKKF